MRKIIIKEDSLGLLKRSNEEVTYFEFMSSLKAFLKLLLSDPYNADVDELFKSHGYSRNDVLGKLKELHMVVPTENVTETPKDELDANSKLVAKHTIKYDIPRKRFKEKSQVMFKEMFGSNVFLERANYNRNKKGIVREVRDLFSREQAFLLEGLIRTYPIEKVVDCFEREFKISDYESFRAKALGGEIPNGFLQIFDGDNGVKCMEVCSLKDLNLIEDIKHLMLVCGYQLSYSEDFEYSSRYLVMTFEPKNQNSIKQQIHDNCHYLWHVTKESILDKILSKGLEPRTSEKGGFHEPCVFFFLREINGDDIFIAGRELYRETPRRDNYVCVKVDVSKTDCEFFYDPNAQGCVYTKENIPPNAICGVEKIEKS